MKPKKSVKMLWDILTTVIASIALLVFGVAMTSGQLSVSAVEWLSWLQPALPVTGWILIVVAILNVVTSILNLFSKK